MVSSETFESDDLPIEVVFQDFYVVPDYQREYVWQTDEVEKLLDDVLREFDQRGGDQYPEYFIGTIVTRHDEVTEEYELIDGQQRLTTLFVIFCGIRDFLRVNGQDTEGVGAQLRARKYDKKGAFVDKYRVTLQYDDSQEALAALGRTREDAPLDQIIATKRSARNILNAYADVMTFIANDLGGDSQAVREFWAYLSKCVKVIRIKSSTLSKALWIFETINRRGRGLDAMDLLKNLLFMHATSDEFDQLKVRWKALGDTLYDIGESPMRFMRYFLLANYASGKLQADEVYEWLTDPRNASRPDFEGRPVEFATELLEAAQAYKNLVAGRLADGQHVPALRNIWHMSHAARQHLILMLAAARTTNDAQVRLAEELEKLYFVYLVTGQRSNRFEVDFVDWAGRIREYRSLNEVEQFIDGVIVPERHALARSFEFNFRSIREDTMPKYRLKYVLAKLAHALDAEAYGLDGEDPLAPYLVRNVEVEHILARAATREVRETFGSEDEVSESLGRLGNLTLLERPLNAAAGSSAFDVKREIYARSRILLTSGLSGSASVGIGTAVNRALDRVSPVECWDLRAFAMRENDLTRLATALWGLPSATEQVD